MITSEISAASNQMKSRVNSEGIYECNYVWTAEEVEKLNEQYDCQQGNWKSISKYLNGPNPLECMMKWQSLHPENTLQRQLWSQEEDEQLKELVQKYGKKWSKICTVMNWRTGKQVRERYLNQLQGHINNEKWTDEEDKIILRLYKKFGTKWSYISTFLNGRPENMVKNRFYANLKRKYQSDLEESDEDDQQEDSQDSLNITKYKKKKKNKQYKFINSSIKIKKSQLKTLKLDAADRMTRSKVKKCTSINVKQENIDMDEKKNQVSEEVFVKEEPNKNENQYNPQELLHQQYQYQSEAFQKFVMEYGQLGINQQQQLLLGVNEQQEQLGTIQQQEQQFICNSNQPGVQFNPQLCPRCLGCSNNMGQLYTLADISHLFKMFQYQMFIQCQPKLETTSTVNMMQNQSQPNKQYNNIILQ
ncbi:unnamed protein product (macronuclear) [Paramecium tetraurelia]|uniref:Uncharacterized protein n=1 Tax=Paramecium tetraurelia TaxID=5888 RepID=A0BY24_PARTE|nr:uncharacterized protein GSPATT00033294001 [Paramecium tetraurelia]CAK63441.1 unnamed protein product [Paramecium tetraurelia]|eukprot:XP_001430839.1 hypothetical protein (macronuclear) [Paramecium tetraurelia strain d4-2]